MARISKGKSDINDPTNLRNIPDKPDLLKMFSTIVMSFAKENINDEMPKYQIASVPGHRAVEHLYVLKSVFAYYKEQNKSLVLTSYDIKTFFDSEEILDCLE